MNVAALRGDVHKASSKSTAMLIAGFLSHTAYLAWRAYSTGHAPMASMDETTAFYGWATVLVSLIVIFRYKERLVALITVPLASLAVFFSILNAKPPAPLTLVLRTRWFEAHVTASFAAYALFTLAFAGAVLYLVHQARQDAGALKRYQEIASRSVLWGFFLFSLSMFAGAIWAYLAWGVYWMWEPKIIWSFIVWFYYAGAMHAYYVRQWRGTGLSIATVIGFFVVMFTYLGVSLLMKSSHSF
ncbi:MAG: cytochrome c biogenesis protein CcsA [Deltaproteobacteria bacterium]|nr:cytochrome c biogenesis protein CcsA [Deltaproteobacteria bacterium]